MMQYDVVITAFSRYKELVETILSVKNQTVKAKNIFVVVDGYDKEIESISLEYDCLFFSLTHVGLPSVARNFGRSLATSQYIAFCDDDDLWIPQKMEIQLSHLENNTHLNFLFTRAIKWDGASFLGFVSRFYGKLNLPILLIWNPCTFSSLVIRNTPDLIFFNTHVDFKAWEDYFFIIECLADNKKGFVLSHPCVFYRINTFNKISTKYNLSRDFTQVKNIYKSLINYNKIFYIPILFFFNLLRILRTIVFSKYKEIINGVRFFLNSLILLLVFCN